MTRRAYTPSILAGMLMAGMLVTPALAECVRVIGTEGGGSALTMDPAFALLNDDAYQHNLVYNRLVNLDSNFQPVPELARSWSVSDDGLTWTFHLEEDVTFHDGKPLTADDVVFTFQRLIDPDLGSPAAGLLTFLDAEGIVAVDEHTVTMTTPDIVAELPILIANRSYVVQDGSTTDFLHGNGIGTGPFVQDVYDIAQSIRIFQRNPDYWREGLPLADCIDLKVINEEVSRIAAIQAGSIDLILSAGPATLTTLAGDPRVTLVASEGAGMYNNLSMEVDEAPFDDARVRLAMKLVVDRQMVVDTMLLGNGIVGNDNPVAPNNPLAYRDDAIPRDVERARELLAEAGYPDGIDIDLNTSDAGPGYVMLAQLYQQMAADAGIRVNIVMSPVDSYWDNVWMQVPFFSSSWNGRAAMESLAYNYSSGATYNEAHWKNAEFDALLDRARADTDADERRALMQQAQEILAEDGGVIIPAFFLESSALRAGCTGYVPHPSASIYNYETLTCAD